MLQGRTLLLEVGECLVRLLEVLFRQVVCGDGKREINVREDTIS